MAMSDRIEIEAIGWRLRVPTLDEPGWAAFTAWLEADPRHAVAYDFVVATEDEADALLHAQRAGAGPAERANPGEADRSRRPVWLAAAAAAMVAVIGGGLSLRGLDRPAPDTAIATAPGEHRDLKLADGSVISLNGDSRLTIDGAHPRRVRLDQGEAVFRIVHHADRPFEVAAGTIVLRDIGTMFDVARRPDGMEIAVGEGSIAYDPDGANVVLVAGQAGRVHGSPITLEIHDVDRAAVGSWRTGRLVYRDAPLPVVATDIGRALGRIVRLDPDPAGRRFSGTIVLTHDDAVMRARLAGLLDVAVIVEPKGRRLRPIARAGR